jgi:hypothetical protein
MTSSPHQMVVANYCGQTVKKPLHGLQEAHHRHVREGIGEQETRYTANRLTTVSHSRIQSFEYNKSPHLVCQTMTTIFFKRNRRSIITRD